MRKKNVDVIIACCCVCEIVETNKPEPERGQQVDPPLIATSSQKLPRSGTSNQNTITTSTIKASMRPMTPYRQQLADDELGSLPRGVTLSCSSVPIMAAQDLIRSGKKATREEIRAHISGNYCRCTGYHAIVDAIEEVING